MTEATLSIRASWSRHQRGTLSACRSCTASGANIKRCSTRRINALTTSGLRSIFGSMADLTKLSLKAGTTPYLFANTPVYLYSRLRAADSVKVFADSTTPRELAAFVAKVDRKRKRGPEDMPLSYSAMV